MLSCWSSQSTQLQTLENKADSDEFYCYMQWIVDAKTLLAAGYCI
ncbi:hypothetical protein PF010_g26678 [Phytophthora fragariae]|uniref:Uncharacterized protein n=1 Tax=Phytophthora fragariae TaxID=53985 RepID=A0A6G0JWN1_9STRA|nr:hypothetical protein PF010_g26678 [Phytophthora fragariae]